jgi:hypothetical protein
MERRRDGWDAGGDNERALSAPTAPTSMQSRRICYMECGSPFGTAGPIIIEAGAVTASLGSPSAGPWYAENQALDPSRGGFAMPRSPSCPIPGAVPPSEVEPASLTSAATASASVRLNAPETGATVRGAHAIHPGEVAWRPAMAAPGSYAPRGGDQAKEKPAGTLARALRAAYMYQPMMLVGETCPTVTVELHRSMCIVLGDQAGTPAGAVKKDLQPCSIQWAPPPARSLTLHSVEKFDMCEGDNGDLYTPNKKSEWEDVGEQVEECNECAICLEPLQMGETIRLFCGHLFCLQCTAQVFVCVCLSVFCLLVSQFLSHCVNGSMHTLSTNIGT